MHDLWLVRHGATEWSKSGQHTGRTDLPLLPEGEDKARELAPRLDRPWSLVLSSPLERARRTAELAGLTPQLDEGLHEWDYGPHEGRTTAEALEEDPNWSVWNATDLGETVEEVGRRAEAVLERIAPALEQGDVCLVGHGHMLRVLAVMWVGLEPAAGRLFPFSAGCVSVLSHEHEAPVIERWNC